jgi:magnesium transporter
VPIDAAHTRANLQVHLASVVELLEKHRVLETWTHNQSSDRQRELLESLVHRQNVAALQQRVKALHPADLAYILQSLPASDRRLVWEQLAPAHAGATLAELTRGVREELIAETTRPTLAAVLATLDSDDLAFVSESVPVDVLEEVYRGRDHADRNWVEASAAYAEDSVGRLMVQDYVAIRDSRTVDEAVAQIRARRRLPRHIDSLFVVDARNVLRGVAPMRDLLLHDPLCPVVDILSEHPVAFTPADKADSAAEAFTRYGLVCAPVVDERGKLLGALAVDAVLEYASDQATRDIQMMGGVEALDAPYDQVPFWDMVRKRGGWLSALFFGEMLTATAMGYYEAEIARAVVLALFVPLIISSGGNSGSQAASLIIRALALKELALRDWVRVFRRELLSGITLGGALGAIGFARILLWQSLHLGDYGRSTCASRSRSG